MVPESYIRINMFKSSLHFCGHGSDSQLTYMITNDLQLGLRYTSITPSEKIERLTDPRTDIAFGISKYFSDHDLKIQADVNYITEKSSVNVLAQNLVLVRVQTDFTF